MIWINAYYRIRFGKIEYVRAHWRRLPDSPTSVALTVPRGA